MFSEVQTNHFSLSAQCPAENCNGDRAYFFQLQIRSADEPMTTFLKVRDPPLRMRTLHILTTIHSVAIAVHDGERTDLISGRVLYFRHSI